MVTPSGILYFFLFCNGLMYTFGSTRYAGSMTPYKEVACYNTSNLNHIENQGYTAKKMWSILRHSERLPGSETIYGINNILPDMYSTSGRCNEVNSWHHSSIRQALSQSGHKQKLLTDEGEKTMRGLGERYRKRFQSLFSGLSPKDIRVRVTAEERTKHSAVNFFNGLFDTEVSLKHMEEATPSNCLAMEFEAECLQWRRFVKAPFKDRLKVYEQIVLSHICNEIQGKCQFNRTINKSLLLLMYETCAFESISMNSPWCEIFTSEQLAKIQYFEDLEFYLNDGYGHQLNGKIACPMMDDVLKFLFSSNNKKKSSSQNIFINFSHVRTMVKFMTHLGLFKDQELDECTYLSPSGREWVTSKIATFAVNLSFVLYEDATGNQKVVLLFNEQVIDIPGCGSLCPVKDFKRLYQKECNWEQLCKSKDKVNRKWYEQFKSDKEKKHKDVGAAFQ